MIELRNSESDRVLGTINEDQLQFLIDHLEETEASDRDYFIDAPTIEMLEEEGADPGLVALLRGAVGDGEGLEVRWSSD
jgi:hypothetical protein